MNENDEAVVKDSSGEIVTIAPADTAFRYIKWHLPDGAYEVIGHVWWVLVDRKDGVIYPRAGTGDVKRLLALLPDPQNN